ncbi:cytochrome P450 [Nocardia sp. NPDC004711]
MTTQSPFDTGQSRPVQFPQDRQCPFDPPDEFNELRDTQPLSRLRLEDGRTGWLVSSHALARAILGDPRFSVVPGGLFELGPARRAAEVLDAIEHDTSFPDSARAMVHRYQTEGRLLEAFQEPEVVQALRDNPPSRFGFFHMDAPAHTRLRRVLAGHFTVRRVGEHRARIEQIVADRLDAMERLGPPVDLVETFASQIPSQVVSAVVGVPENGRSVFERLNSARLGLSSTADEAVEAVNEYLVFIRELIARQRAQPGADLIGALVQNGEMTDDEIVSSVFGLLSAGTETTNNSLGYGVATLLQDRARWDALRTEATPVGQIVEELLRYTTVLPTAQIRTAREDVEVDGTVIKAFETVVVSLSAANRDPQIFAEPDRIDPTRASTTKHIAFGYGIHQCLGQHLGRLELQVALAGLAHRFPTLDLAVPVEEIPWRNGARPYGPERLPVTW